MASNSSRAPRRSTSKRTQCACRHCRRRKVKCSPNEDLPNKECKRCRERQLLCEYVKVGLEDISMAALDSQHLSAPPCTPREPRENCFSMPQYFPIPRDSNETGGSSSSSWLQLQNEAVFTPEATTAVQAVNPWTPSIYDTGGPSFPSGNPDPLLTSLSTDSILIHFPAPHLDLYPTTYHVPLQESLGSLYLPDDNAYDYQNIFT